MLMYIQHGKCNANPYSSCVYHATRKEEENERGELCLENAGWEGKAEQMGRWGWAYATLRWR
jgi:hypothetical protein